MSKEFKNKVVIVSGGTGHLGTAVTNGLVERGATVVVPFISEMLLNIMLTNHRGLAQAVRFARVDLTNSGESRRFTDGVLEREGRIDILVNLAGGYIGGTTVADSRSGQFNDMLDINFKTAYSLCRAAVPPMTSQGGGKIVTVGARAGLSGSSGHAAYAIAKSAVMRFTEALADEVKHDGINVNCVVPGIIDTGENRRDMPDADFDTWVTTEEVAEVIYFLCSDQARAIHGASIPVYGKG